MKTVWYYAGYSHTIQQYDVRDDTPVGVWLPNMLCKGEYIYVNTLEEIKEIAKRNILMAISDLNDRLEDIMAQEE